MKFGCIHNASLAVAPLKRMRFEHATLGRFETTPQRVRQGFGGIVLGRRAMNAEPAQKRQCGGEISGQTDRLSHEKKWGIYIRRRSHAARSQSALQIAPYSAPSPISSAYPPVLPMPAQGALWRCSGSIRPNARQPSLGRQNPVHRRPPDAKLPRNLCGPYACLVQLRDICRLCLCCRLPALVLARCLSLGNALALSLQHDVSLELCNAAQHVKHEPITGN